MRCMPSTTPTASRGCATPQHGLSSNKMALVTSDYGIMRSPSIKWPESPRTVRALQEIISLLYKYPAVAIPIILVSVHRRLPAALPPPFCCAPAAFLLPFCCAPAAFLSKTAPSRCGPSYQERLKQKNDEWVRLRIDYAHDWKKTMASTFYKALDHRSFYFKQVLPSPPPPPSSSSL